MVQFSKLRVYLVSRSSCLYKLYLHRIIQKPDVRQVFNTRPCVVRELPMHAQTEFPVPVSDINMYIHENSSNVGIGRINNHSVFLAENGSYMLNNFYSEQGMLRQGSQQTVRGIILVIFIAMGTVFNSFMIVAVVPNRRLRTVRNLLLVHLGCTGLLLSYLINLVTAVVSFTGKWFGGVILCQIYGYIMSVLTLVSTWTIAALSWDKYQTIASPLQHSFTATTVKMVVCFSVFWSAACCLSLPPLLGGDRFVFHPQKSICFVCTKSLAGKVYIFAYVIAAIYIPLGIMLYCYTHIYKIARTQSSRIAATMVRMTCVIQATIAPASQATNLSIKGTKAMCTIFQLVGAFVLVYIPISVILCIQSVSSDASTFNSVITATFTMLFHSAPVVNSALYGLRNKILRTSFHRYMRRKIRYYCYKDKRKNSVKSFRSSSFKVIASRRHQQNGDTASLRRTQSFPVRGYTRSGARTPRDTPRQNGGQTLTVKETVLTRPHSYNVLNPETPESVREIIDEKDEENLPEDILHIDAEEV